LFIILKAKRYLLKLSSFEKESKVAKLTDFLCGFDILLRFV